MSCSTFLGGIKIKISMLFYFSLPLCNNSFISDPDMMSWAFGLLKNTTPNQTFRCLMRTLIPLTAVRLSRMLLLTQDAALVVNCAKTIFHLGESRWCCVAVFWDSCPSLFTSSSRRGEASRLQREAWSWDAHNDSPSMHSVSLVSARAADRTADAQIALITADYSR